MANPHGGENLALLSLYPATPAQVIASRERSFVEWHQGRTLEECLKRDEILDDFENSANGRLTTWVLAPRDTPDTLDFRCSCETFRRVAMISRPIDHKSTRKVEEVVSYAIASVFTPAEKRGRGYASHMMKLLHWVLAPRHSLPKVFPSSWGSPPTVPDGYGNAQFSVLYSDVGPHFYFRCGPDGRKTGWRVTGPIHTIWDVASTRGTLQSPAPDNLSWLWLSTEQCITLWASDLAIMQRELQSIHSHGTMAFSFKPNDGTSIWNIYKTMCFTQELEPYLPCETWGVLLTGGTSPSKVEPPTFATWIYDFRSTPRSLIVTRIRVTRSRFKALFAKIVEVALQQQVERIEMWDLNPELADGALCPVPETGGRTLPRQGHLPSVKWYGEIDETKLTWKYNERFAWC